MKVKIYVTDNKITGYYGFFLTFERKLIDEAFRIKYTFKKARNGDQYLEVVKLDEK